MVDVLVVGSLNVDTFLTVEKLPKPGETLHGESIHKFPGGKGANQAVALARLGGNVAVLGMVGNDADGEMLRVCLKENGIDTSYLSTASDQPTGSAMIIVDKQGNNEIIVFSGANACVDAGFIERSKTAFVGAKILLMQYEIPIKTIEYMIGYAAEKRLPVVINPSPYYPLADEFLRKIDYLILNESEASAMTGAKIDSIDQARSAAEEIVQKGVRHVVVTLGDRGSVICAGQGPGEHVAPYKVHPVDTTGSGDAFLGAFLFSLLSNKTFREAVDFANAVGALTVTKMGAQTSLPYLKEAMAFINLSKQ